MKKGVYSIFFQAKRGSILHFYNEYWREAYISSENGGSFLYLLTSKKGGLSGRAYLYTFSMGVPPPPRVDALLSGIERSSCEVEHGFVMIPLDLLK